MSKHTRYYDTRTQAVIAWIALHTVAFWCWVVSPNTRHRPAEGRFPVSLFIPRRPKKTLSALEWPGADDAFAAELKVMNEDPAVRPEVRA